jgi:trk system potassium uptake protein TrkA
MNGRNRDGLRERQGGDFAVVVGCGRLGAHIAAALAGSGEGVVVIDASGEAFHNLPPAFVGITVTGDATELHVLDEANLREAGSLIAVTERDNTNIMVAQLARAMYGVPRVIARLYDQERECVCEDFGIRTISPVLLSTKEIEHMLRPGAADGEGEARR